MALKKKGTPEKIEVVVKESELEKWRKLINESVGTGDIVTVKPPKKDKK